MILMPVELRVPEVGESIKEVMIGPWRKQVGQPVAKDESVVEIESDKATVDLPAPVDGVIERMLKQQGQTAAVGEVIGYLTVSNEAPNGTPAAPSLDHPTAASATAPTGREPATPAASSSAAPAAAPKAAAPTTTVEVQKSRGQTAIGSVQPAPKTAAPSASPSPPTTESTPFVMPAAARILSEHGLSPQQTQPTGPGGRVLKEDAQAAAATRQAAPSKPAPTVTAPPKPAELARPSAQPLKPSPAPTDIHVAQQRNSREEDFVVMSPIRRRIAQRLVEAQQTAALLTTINEIDMGEVMALRQKHKDAYQQRYGVKLGFMSFFVKAAVDALRMIPQVNAEVREPHIVYHHYYDIGIAVGGGKGLVVPVLRSAENMSFGEIELAIADFAKRASDNKLKLEELQGGTFTISNGGVYGSLLSTPIVNPPQSGILGLHAIQDRPVARNGQVVIRPMMYIALTYDHRIVDGREAVTFLKRIKETIEDPSRLFLEV